MDDPYFGSRFLGALAGFVVVTGVWISGLVAPVPQKGANAPPPISGPDRAAPAKPPPLATWDQCYGFGEQERSPSGFASFTLQGSEPIRMFATSQFSTCWNRNLEGVFPIPPRKEIWPDTKVVYTCRGRETAFEAQYFQRIDGRVVGSTVASALVKNGTAAPTGNNVELEIEIDFPKSTYRWRRLGAAEWLINTNTATDLFLIDSGSRNFVCLDHFRLPTHSSYQDGQIYACAFGINLETIELHWLAGIVPEGKYDTPAERIVGHRATRAFGPCERTDLTGPSTTQAPG